MTDNKENLKNHNISAQVKPFFLNKIPKKVIEKTAEFFYSKGKGSANNRKYDH